MSRRLMKWSFELREFKIIYCPHLAIKTQAIVDFLVEITNDSEGEWTLGGWARR